MDAAVAIVVAGGMAFASPLFLNYLTTRTRRRERAEDFARQDEVAREAREVARQAREAAVLLSRAQELTIAKTDEVAETARVESAKTTSALKQIHTLVNSDMTAARQGELNQARTTLTALRAIIELGENVGRPVTVDQLAAIEETEKRITELEQILADRMTQMRIVEEEQKIRAEEAQSR